MSDVARRATGARARNYTFFLLPQQACTAPLSMTTMGMNEERASGSL